MTFLHRGAGAVAFDQTAELPRSVPTPPASFPTINGTTTALTTSSTFTDLQNAVNAHAARDGSLNHLITIPAQGASPFVLTGANLNLPPKSGTNASGTGWIIITTAGYASLPARGTRIRPSVNRTNLARLRLPSNSSNPVINTQDGAHHYWLAGLELETNPTNAAGTICFTLVGFGSASNYNLVVEPDWLIMDRCFVHGQVDAAWSDRNTAALPAVNHGVGVHGKNTAIVDSWIEEIHSQNQDTQTIFGGGGHGPYLIDNNFLQASGETIVFGGFDPATPNILPADITFTRNECTKDSLWWQNDLGYSVKNLFELKFANRVLIEGNVFHNTWNSSAPTDAFTHAADGQQDAIVFKAANQNGGGTWIVTDNVTFRYNNIYHAPGAGQWLGNNQNTNPGSHNWSIHDNVFWDIRRVAGSHSVWMNIMAGEFSRSGGTTGGDMTNIYFANNTFHYADTYLAVTGDGTGYHEVSYFTFVGDMTSWTWRNNICTGLGQYGPFLVGASNGSTINAAVVSVTVEGNVWAATPDQTPSIITAGLPPHQTVVADIASVGFVNSTSPTSVADLALAPGSPALTSGYNGTAYSGADVATIISKTSGVVVAR